MERGVLKQSWDMPSGEAEAFLVLPLYNLAFSAALTTHPLSLPLTYAIRMHGAFLCASPFAETNT